MIELLESTLRVSTPLLLVAFGGIFSERSGVINIALEGMMLFGAFVGAVGAHAAGSLEWGYVAGGLGGLITALLYSILVLNLRADQIVSGTAINLFAYGLTPVLCRVLYDSSASSPSLTLATSKDVWTTIVLALLFLALSHHFIIGRLGGLWIRIAGEKPEALDAAGVSVYRVRLLSLLFGGFLAGLGGAVLSVVLSSSFTRGMTGGRGFMALAAVIFGQWRPVPAAFACLLFGFTDALQIRLQGVELFGFGVLPVQLIQISPYLFTVLILAGFVGRVRAPHALGRS